MRYVAIDPKDGRHMREATDEEVRAYLAQRDAREGFRKAECFDVNVRVGDVVIGADNGLPGIAPNWTW